MTINPQPRATRHQARRDEILARVVEARRRGRCAYAEGTPGNVNPFSDQDLAQAWLGGWWDGFKNDRKTA